MYIYRYIFMSFDVFLFFHLLGLPFLSVVVGFGEQASCGM